MKNRIVLLLCASLFVISCKNEANKEGVKIENAKADSIIVVNDNHNSQKALDWQGTYKGTTPCADCEGIETELILNKDLTFVLKTKYLGKEKQNIFEEKGTFTWNALGSIISLKGMPNQYKVGENTLTQLDMEGKAVAGVLADRYVLKK